MPQLYLNLPTTFIEISPSCTKLSVHTCYNKAGRFRYQVPYIKTNISSDLIIIILSNFTCCFPYIVGHVPVNFWILKNKKVYKVNQENIKPKGFFTHPL